MGGVTVREAPPPSAAPCAPVFVPACSVFVGGIYRLARSTGAAAWNPHVPAVLVQTSLVKDASLAYVHLKFGVLRERGNELHPILSIKKKTRFNVGIV